MSGDFFSRLVARSRGGEKTSHAGAPLEGDHTSVIAPPAPPTPPIALPVVNPPAQSEGHGPEAGTLQMPRPTGAVVAAMKLAVTAVPAASAAAAREAERHLAETTEAVTRATPAISKAAPLVLPRATQTWSRPRAAEPSRSAEPPTPGDSQVRITIGRVEVRAYQSPKPPPASQKTARRLGLDDYLASRSTRR